MASLVSIHAPARGATMRFLPAWARAGFQSTRPRGARRKSRMNSRRGWGFNPRARAGRDQKRIEAARISVVSIHAPARGATCAGIVIEVTVLFQSTRPRGARHGKHGGNRHGKCFNPRARAGRDSFLLPFARGWLFQSTRPRGARRVGGAEDREALDVSIHAPARGATRWRIQCRKNSKFQSTRPRGARPAAGFCGGNAVCFNPRARAGRDSRVTYSRFSIVVSIHAPARGATLVRKSGS